MNATPTMNEKAITKMAISATLHCLLGCAIGEVLGMIIGTAFGLSNHVTILLAISLAFLFGYALSSLPLVRAGMPLKTALKLVLAADTLSILTMEIVDNLVMVLIPGAMDATLIDPLFWVSMAIAFAVAFFAAVPVNKYLLRRNKGHAITMKHLPGHTHHHAATTDDHAHHTHTHHH